MIDASNSEHADGCRRFVRRIKDFRGGHNGPSAVASTCDEDAAISECGRGVPTTWDDEWTKLFDLTGT